MGLHTPTLQYLCRELLGPAEERQLEALVKSAVSAPLNFEAVIAFDDSLVGPSLSRLREVRYQPADRDVFRPLQYVDMEFRAAIRFGEMEWRARDIVEMASLHVESLIKRIGRVGRMPLGAALGNVLVQRRVDAVTYRRIRRYVAVYNAAKHDMDQPMGTHLFSEEDAVRAYTICRKLALPLYPLAGLVTDMRTYA